MESNYLEQTFEKKNYTAEELPKGVYEYCRFTHCDLSGSDLSGIRFLECEFTDCNLSLVKLDRTAFQDVRFKDCKMLGLRFENCSDFGFAVSFDHCVMNDSSFYRLRLKKTLFRQSSLHDADFTECDLSAAHFDHSDLARATFDQTILEKADLRTALNYSINPQNNRIKKAKFALSGIRGLLDQYDIEIS